MADAKKATISPKDFALVRDLIKERTGIHIRDTRSDYLEYRIAERMAANSLTRAEEYYYFLKYSPVTAGEFQALINIVTVHETSFFRNPDQINTFKGTLLRDIVASKAKAGEKKLRIWSAACSTGEEPLTIAMVVNETIPYVFTWHVEVLATDISTWAVDTARKALYTEKRMGEIPKELVDKYFSKNGIEYTARESLSNMIRYRHLNLAGDLERDMPGERETFDIIFCRNVFIYFPHEVQEQIVSFFYKALAPGGYILLGNAESIDVRKFQLNMTFLPGGMIYQKPPHRVGG